MGTDQDTGLGQALQKGHLKKRYLSPLQGVLLGEALSSPVACFSTMMSHTVVT